MLVLSNTGVRINQSNFSLENNFQSRHPVPHNNNDDFRSEKTYGYFKSMITSLSGIARKDFPM